MPLMKPEVQKVLRAAGLAPEATKADGRTVSEQLDAVGLSMAETLEELAIVAKSSGNDALRLRALETALKAHGALKESAPSAPSFTIVIQEAVGNNSTSPSSSELNLNLPNNINPILLPRQLLKTLPSTDVPIN